MPIILTASDAYVQFITVLVIFVVVLAVCAYTTKWISNYQKKQGTNMNTEIIETSRIGNNKWIQIVRVGKTFKVLAICKDTVTFLGDVPEEQLKLQNFSGDGSDKGITKSFSFKDLLDKAVKKGSCESTEHRDKESDE